MLSPRAHRRWIIAIVLIALLIRVGWCLSRPTGDDALAALPDQREYLDLGRSLLEGRGLHFYDERFRSVVHAYRMPLYPALVAGCFADVRAVRLVQSAMDASTVLAVALLAFTLLPPERRRAASAVAAAIVALNPFLVYFTGLILSETLFTAMLAWGMLLLIVGAKGGRMSDRDAAGDLLPHCPRLGTLLWLLGGLVIAGSTAARPARGAGVQPFRVRWPLPVATTMLILTVAVLTPWACRNSAVTGHWLWTTSNSGVTAWDGFNPDATGASDQSGLRMMPQLASMNEVERSSYLSSRATDYIRQNPRRAVELAVIKAGRTWSPMPLSADYGNWMYRLAGLGYAMPFDLLVLIGICAAPIRRSAKALLLAPAVYFTLVHMASVGSLRYRIPVEPPLAVLAAAGATMIGVPKLGWRRKE